MTLQDDATESPPLAPILAYQRGLADGKLTFQRCRTCRSAIFYPRVLCPQCGSTALEWQESPGVGTVYAATTVHKRDADPYNVVLVDFDDGFRMMSCVVGVPADQVSVGARVQAEIADLDGQPAAVVRVIEEEAP